MSGHTTKYEHRETDYGERCYCTSCVREALEWGSCDNCGGHDYCVFCGASRHGYDPTTRETHPGKHRDGCPALDLLAHLAHVEAEAKFPPLSPQ